MKVTRSYK